MRMQTDAPTNKVSAATIAAALTSLLLYVLKAYVIKDATGLPDVVEYAIGVLVTAAVTFAAGYFRSPAPQDKSVTEAEYARRQAADSPPPAGIP